MTLIESRDGRFRATLRETDDGIRYTLMRHAGFVDSGGDEVMWRVLGAATLDVPFHVACDRIEHCVWTMTDDRLRVQPVRRRSTIIKVLT